jgi:hypothetical protein
VKDMACVNGSFAGRDDGVKMTVKSDVETLKRSMKSRKLSNKQTT